MSYSSLENMEELIASLSLDEAKEALLSELGVLQSIYGEDSVRMWHPSSDQDAEDTDRNGRRRRRELDDRTIRYEVQSTFPPPESEVDTEVEPLTIRILVSLPHTYPGSSPPQLQLLNRYIGPYQVDAALFGATLRTYISKDGVEWSSDASDVCVFDGVENVRERCAKWYQERLSQKKEEPEEQHLPEKYHPVYVPEEDPGPTIPLQPPPIPVGVEIFVAEPITDRKSVFIGRACRITQPSQVTPILNHLLSDRRIARAAHPIINAWRCRVGTVLHQDNDDDGETAAGGRLAHLLQILDVQNVLVIVTRYFGGIHLGPDRFKHINQAARNALDMGGFLVTAKDAKEEGNKKTKGKKKS